MPVGLATEAGQAWGAAKATFAEAVGRPALAFSPLSRLPAGINQQVLLPLDAILPKSPPRTERQAMAHNFAINEDVHHQPQGPQGRTGTREQNVYTIITRMPIESDGRPRYRIKSKAGNVERVVTEEQIRRLD